MAKPIVATAVDGVMIIDAAGTVQEYNPSCERLFGYRAEEVVGQDIDARIAGIKTHKNEVGHDPFARGEAVETAIGLRHRLVQRGIDGQPAVALLAVEGHQDDGVVDHDAGEPEQAEQRQHGQVEPHQPVAQQRAHQRQRDRRHDDQRQTP